MFLLVSYSYAFQYQVHAFVDGQDQRTKKLAGFHSQFVLLTMVPHQSWLLKCDQPETHPKTVQRKFFFNGYHKTLGKHET